MHEALLSKLWNIGSVFDLLVVAGNTGLVAQKIIQIVMVYPTENRV